MVSARLLLVSVIVHVGAIQAGCGPSVRATPCTPPPLVQIELSTFAAESGVEVLPTPCVATQPIVTEPVETEPIVSEAESPSAFAAQDAVELPDREEVLAPELRLAAVARMPIRSPQRVSPASPPLLIAERTIDEPPLAPELVSHTAARVVAPIAGRSPPPEYPAVARRRGCHGTVMLRLVCDADGHVIEVTLLQSSGHAILDDAAIAAARRWRLAGGPGSCEQPFEFRLR
jgi:periplasmic protein TonB